MFNSARIAARRAASRSSLSAAAESTTQSSVTAAAALLLVAVAAGERHGQGESSVESAKCEDINTSSHAQSHIPHNINQHHNQDSPYRNFVATSALSNDKAQCEHSSATSYHSGLIPDHDLRLQRAVTSKRMATEKSRRTFFSAYEVEFDNPLGSGKLWTYPINLFLQCIEYAILSKHFSLSHLKQGPMGMYTSAENVTPRKHAHSKKFPRNSPKMLNFNVR